MYQGHLADGSSVQKHSAGGIYPYVLYAQQGSEGLRWRILSPAGDVFNFPGYAAALRTAVKWKAEDVARAAA